MRVKHVKGWLELLKRKKQEPAEEGEGKTDDEEGRPTEPNWEILADLIQMAFREGRLAEEATWQAVVLTLKVKMTTLESAWWS